jgi:hypothetical protein
MARRKRALAVALALGLLLLAGLAAGARAYWEETRVVEIQPRHEAVTAIAPFGPDAFVLGGALGTLEAMRIDEPTELWTVELERGISGLAVADGLVAAALGDGSLRVVRDGFVVASIAAIGTPERPLALALLPEKETGGVRILWADQQPPWSELHVEELGRAKEAVVPAKEESVPLGDSVRDVAVLEDRVLVLGEEALFSLDRASLQAERIPGSHGGESLAAAPRGAAVWSSDGRVVLWRPGAAPVSVLDRAPDGTKALDASGTFVAFGRGVLLWGGGRVAWYDEGAPFTLLDMERGVCWRLDNKKTLAATFVGDRVVVGYEDGTVQILPLPRAHFERSWTRVNPEKGR